MVYITLSGNACQGQTLLLIGPNHELQLKKVMNTEPGIFLSAIQKCDVKHASLLSEHVISKEYLCRINQVY